MFFIKTYWRDILIGALAGFANGLLGAGGGIIVTYYLSHALSDEQKKENGVFANAVATMLPVSVFSFSLYCFKGIFKPDSAFFHFYRKRLSAAFSVRFC